MPLDLSKLSDEELVAIKSGDLSKISNETLSNLKQSFSEDQTAQQPEQAPQPQEQQPQEPRGFMSYAGEAMTKIPRGIMGVATGTGGASQLTEGAQAALNALQTPSAIRNIPPMATAVMMPPSALASAAGTFAPLASSAATSAMAWLSSHMAGDTNAEATKNAIQAAYVGRGITPTEGLIKTAIKETGKEIAQIAGLTYAGQTAQRSIESGFLNPPTFKEAWEEGKYSIPMSMFSGGLRAISAKSQFQQQLVENARKEIGAFINADEMTLGMIDPANYAAIESQIAANNPKLFAQISKVGKDVTDRYNSLFGKIAHPGEIATELNKYAGKLDEEKSTLAKLQDARVQAEQNLADIAGMNLSKAEENQLRMRVTAAKMAEANQNARVQFWQGLNDQTLGKLPRSSDTANAFSKAVDEIFTHRSEAAAQAYEDAGVPLKEKFIPVKDLISAAKRSVSDRRGPIADAMISEIKNMGGKDGLISVLEMRDMRRRFSDIFANAAENQLDSVEAAAKLIYGGVTRKTASIIESQFGKDVASKFQDVNSWWGETANAANSRYMRQIVSAEPGKDMIPALARDIAAGKMQDINKFGEFINAISQLAPDVAKIGTDALHKAVRESFIINAAANSNEIDFRKLTESLNAASSRLRKGDPISIEALGFGNRKQLSDVLSAYREYGSNGAKISAEALDEFYSNPLVREQIAAGKSLTVLARKSAAKAAFEREVNTQMLAEIADAKIGSESYQKAKLAADRAGVSVDEQRAVIAKLKNSEIAKAFENMPQIGVNAFNGREGQITAMFQQMNPKDAKRIYEAIQSQRPALADKIQRRVVADLLNYATSNTTNPGQTWSIDGKKVAEMFNPNLQDKGNPIHLLREIMPKDNFNEFKSSLSAFARLSDYQKYGGIGNMPADMLKAFGIGGTIAMNRPGGAAGAIGLVKQLYDTYNGIKYNLAAGILTDKQLSNAYFGLGSAAGPTATAATRLELMLNDDKELGSEFRASKR